MQQSDSIATQPEPESVLPVEADEPLPAAEAPSSFLELVELAGSMRNLRLKTALESQVRLVKFELGRLEINLLEGAPRDLPGQLSDKLNNWTGSRWMVIVSQESGEPTLAEQQKAAEADRKTQAADLPEVKQILEVFPGAEIVSVREEETGENTSQDNVTSEMTK